MAIASYDVKEQRADRRPVHQGATYFAQWPFGQNIG